jgi:glycosyltransferase involved in cell wall biosynthesis
VEVDGRGLNRDGRVRALGRCMDRFRPDIVLPLGIVDANEAVIRRKRQGAEVRLVGRAQGNLEPMLADLVRYRDWFDAVVCPGRLTRKFLVDWAGFAPDRVSNIANGADAPVRSQVPHAEAAPLRIGYVGRLSQPDKRAMDLAPLCAELDRIGIDYRLDVVGDGPCGPELRQALSAFDERVRMHGVLAQSDIYERIFPDLDVLVMTSASEAFGIVLVEAMMHGVVPVSSRYDGFRAEGLVLEEETGLSFEIGDMAQAARAVGRFASEPSLLGRLAAGARAKASEYGWSSSMERWEAQLKSIAERRPVQGGAVPDYVGQHAAGRLERLGLPAGMTDALRRARRAVFGPAVQAGGVEWPLYYRTHAPAELEEIRRALRQLDVPA